jgi:hypothetical protein
MRELANADRVERFMGELARATRSAANVYLTGGASAVLLGWRATTVDVDLKLVPDSDEALRANSQALAKVERGHVQDVTDVASMRAAGLVEDRPLIDLLAAIEPELYRFPPSTPGTSAVEWKRWWAGAEA